MACVCRLQAIYPGGFVLSQSYNPSMQSLVIGDIHGCYTELQALLDAACLTDGDAVISVGDCVDRGPATPQVLAFFRDTPHAQLIMGNHERKHVRGRQGEVQLARSQQISRIQFGEAYPDALTFMSGLQLYLELPEALIVHGYFEPGLSCAEQSPSVLCGTMGGEKHLQSLYDRPWYERYDAAKPIVVGHKNYTGTHQPFVFRDRVFGLDTDCVTGRALTGLLLPSFHFVSVPSRANYWLQVQALYAKPMRIATPKPTVTWNGDEEKALLDLIGRVQAIRDILLHELQSEPDYLDLSPRKQALWYGERTGSGALGTLLQLARLGKLDMDRAGRIVKSPSALPDLLLQIEARDRTRLS